MDQEDPAWESIGLSVQLLETRSLPILVLLQQWSRDKNWLVNTRLILYLLQCMQSLYWTNGRGEFKPVTLKGIMSKISSITELSKQYKQSLRVTSTDMNELMKLFRDLEELFTSKDENTVSILNRCAKGVFAGFLRQCVVEYKGLTFAQLRLLQQRWNEFLASTNSWTTPLTIIKKDCRQGLTDMKQAQDFSESLKTLTLSKAHAHSAGSESLNLEDKALELAMLLSYFSHKEESGCALNEAIRLAQLSENPIVLQYSLALLYKIAPNNSHESTALIRQLVKNAERLQQPLLISTGRLQLAKTQLRTAADPRKVLRSIQTCSFDVLQSEEKRNSKSAVRSGSLLLLSSAWTQYGQSRLSILPLQLLCHMTRHSSTSPLLGPQLEVFVKAVISIARLLESDGNTDKALLLIQAALSHLPSSSSTQPQKLLMVCLAELQASLAFRRQDYNRLSLEISKLETFDPFLAKYWLATMMKGQGYFKVAMETCQSLVQELRNTSNADGGHNRPLEAVKLEIRTLLLQSRVLVCERQTTLALQRATECLSLCHRYGLLQLATQSKLQLATVQLFMCSAEQCRATLMECLPTLFSHGSVEDRVHLFLLLAQVELLSSGMSAGHHSRPGDLDMNGAHSALEYLSHARRELESLFSPFLLRQVLVLEANIHHLMGDAC